MYPAQPFVSVSNTRRPSAGVNIFLPVGVIIGSIAPSAINLSITTSPRLLETRAARNKIDAATTGSASKSSFICFSPCTYVSRNVDYNVIGDYDIHITQQHAK